MGKRKRKRKLSAEEKAAKEKRRQEYETVFVHGRMKRVPRAPTLDGMSVQDFIDENADAVFLHQEELWEDLEAESDISSQSRRSSAMTSSSREPVSFITVQDDDDLIVAFAIALEDPGEIASLILQRTPKYELLLPPEERGVAVSHELYTEDAHEMVRHAVVDGSQVDIESTARTYRLDLSDVDPREVADAQKVLQRMYRCGGFTLDV